MVSFTNEFEDFMEKKIMKLQKERDVLFEAYGISKKDTYKYEQFNKLPAKLLSKVKELDAYVSIKSSYDRIKGED